MDQIFGAGVEFMGLVGFREGGDRRFQFRGKRAAKNFFARTETGDERAVGGASPSVLKVRDGRKDFIEHVLGIEGGGFAGHFGGAIDAEIYGADDNGGES